MSTTYNHIRMSAVDTEGNVRVMYPETTASDVVISRAVNPNIPTTVTNLQLLANALTGSAFNEPINDAITSSERTWSSNKVNTELTNINVYTDSNNELYFTDNDGTDHHIQINRSSGTATAAQVLSGYTFSNASSLGINGEMVNQGSKTYTINPGGSQTIPQGYHDGTGYVTANPNQNSTTYTYPAGSVGGTVDMGVNNIYRYVNAAAVYTQGKADGVTTHTGTYTIDEETELGSTIDLGVTHTYRYVEVPEGGSSEIDILGSVLGYSTSYTTLIEIPAVTKEYKGFYVVTAETRSGSPAVGIKINGVNTLIDNTTWGTNIVKAYSSYSSNTAGVNLWYYNYPLKVGDILSAKSNGSSYATHTFFAIP